LTVLILDELAIGGKGAAMDESELAFLEGIRALITKAIEAQSDPREALKTLAGEVRERIRVLEEARSEEP
jgi:hypothetical protein